MDIDEFLKVSNGRAGFMVAVVGRHAPRFVHTGDGDSDARALAIIEAERILHMDGCGRALVLRLEAVVDQPPAALPKPSVRHVKPHAVEFPFDDVVKIGVKLARLTELEAALAKHSAEPVEAMPAADLDCVSVQGAPGSFRDAPRTFECGTWIEPAPEPTSTVPAIPKWHGHTAHYAMRRIIVQDGIVTMNTDGPVGCVATPEQILASDADEFRVKSEIAKMKPAPLGVREHGIYERRDGQIVGPAKVRTKFPNVGNRSQRPWEISGLYYTPDGREDPHARHLLLDEDLVREIVVGEGWEPWNGGLVFASNGERVDIVTRECAAGLGSIVRDCAAFALRWSHEGKPDDILAYREISKVDEPPFKPGDAVTVTEGSGYQFEATVACCAKGVRPDGAGEWVVSFVGGGARLASNVRLSPREA